MWGLTIYISNGLFVVRFVILRCLFKIGYSINQCLMIKTFFSEMRNQTMLSLKAHQNIQYAQ